MSVHGICSFMYSSCSNLKTCWNKEKTKVTTIKNVIKKHVSTEYQGNPHNEIAHGFQQHHRRGEAWLKSCTENLSCKYSSWTNKSKHVNFFLIFVLFGTGSQYVDQVSLRLYEAQASFEFVLWLRLPTAGITGLYHHTTPITDLDSR